MPLLFFASVSFSQDDYCGGGTKENPNPNCGFCRQTQSGANELLENIRLNICPSQGGSLVTGVVNSYNGSIPGVENFWYCVSNGICSNCAFVIAGSAEQASLYCCQKGKEPGNPNARCAIPNSIGIGVTVGYLTDMGDSWCGGVAGTGSNVCGVDSAVVICAPLDGVDPDAYAACMCNKGAEEYCEKGSSSDSGASSDSGPEPPGGGVSSGGGTSSGGGVSSGGGTSSGSGPDDGGGTSSGGGGGGDYFIPCGVPAIGAGNEGMCGYNNVKPGKDALASAANGFTKGGSYYVVCGTQSQVSPFLPVSYFSLNVTAGVKWFESSPGDTVYYVGLLDYPVGNYCQLPNGYRTYQAAHCVRFCGEASYECGDECVLKAQGSWYQWGSMPEYCFRNCSSGQGPYVDAYGGDLDTNALGGGPGGDVDSWFCIREPTSPLCLSPGDVYCRDNPHAPYCQPSSLSSGSGVGVSAGSGDGDGGGPPVPGLSSGSGVSCSDLKNCDWSTLEKQLDQIRLAKEQDVLLNNIVNVLGFMKWDVEDIRSESGQQVASLGRILDQVFAHYRKDSLTSGVIDLGFQSVVRGQGSLAAGIESIGWDLVSLDRDQLSNLKSLYKAVDSYLHDFGEYSSEFIGYRGKFDDFYNQFTYGWQGQFGAYQSHFGSYTGSLFTYLDSFSRFSSSQYQWLRSKSREDSLISAAGWGSVSDGFSGLSDGLGGISDGIGGMNALLGRLDSTLSSGNSDLMRVLAGLSDSLGSLSGSCSGTECGDYAGVGDGAFGGLDTAGLSGRAYDSLLSVPGSRGLRDSADAWGSRLRASTATPFRDGVSCPASELSIDPCVSWGKSCAVSVCDGMFSIKGRHIFEWIGIFAEFVAWVVFLRRIA